MQFGQLGLGDLEDRNAPTPITSSPLAGQHTRLLACGWRHTLAVSEEGQMFTWGRGTNGQLGHGSEDDRCARGHHCPARLAFLRGLACVRPRRRSLSFACALASCRRG